MATCIDKERLREEFERVASSDGSDSEARLASPGVEGMVVFLASIATGQPFESEQVRHVFEAKGWAEGADITFSEIEALVEALFEVTQKTEEISKTKRTDDTEIEENSQPPAEDIEVREKSMASSLSNTLSEDSIKSSVLLKHSIYLGADEGELKKRKLLVDKITPEQSNVADASISEAYKSYLSSFDSETASYLPQQPPAVFAAKHYYRQLKQAIDEKSTTSSAEMKNSSEKVTVSPMKRIKKSKEITEPEEVSIAELHSTAKVGGEVHFNGYLMGAEDSPRSVDVNDPKTGLEVPSTVVNVVLADEGGAIQLTLWRDQAKSIHPIIDRALAAVGANLCAKARLTNLVLRDVRHPALKVRMLHSTEKTELILAGEQELEMSPSTKLFPTTDFRELNKLSFPVMLHLRGVIMGESVERTTSKGAEQICFSLMDANKRTVPCIGHEISFPKELFKEGAEVALFGVTVQEGIRNGSGNIWIYSTSYVAFLGNRILPGTAMEAVVLKSKDK